MCLSFQKLDGGIRGEYKGGVGEDETLSFQEEEIRGLLRLIIVVLLIVMGISIFYKFRSEKTPKVNKEEIRILILNGCGEPKLAKRGKKFLEFSGFNVVDIGDTSHDFTETVVADHKYEDKRNALFLAKFLHIPKHNVVYVKDTLMQDVMNVTLILGADYKKYIPDTVRAIQ